MSYIHIGLDVGSTTVKVVVLNTELELVYSKYERHFSDIRKTVLQLLESILKHYSGYRCSIKVTGSGGLGIATWLEIPFIQEVVACSKTVRRIIPKTDVAIELGGEDAKITYFDGNSIDQRMNGTCAGGTGAFIDQMGALLQTDAKGLNELAKNHKVIHPIAARCGVFAKTDVQPLLNEGAAKEDIAASIFQAVVNQTISGLACGKPIRGNVAFLGGPLYFLSELRQRFIETLNLSKEQIIFPEHSQLFVAFGAALESITEELVRLEDIVKKCKDFSHIYTNEVERLEPLFDSEDDLTRFLERHDEHKVVRGDLATYSGPCYMGIDAGSTTTKVAVIGESRELLYSFYGSNEGKPLQQVIRILNEIYKALPKEAYIAYSTVTGYGEALIKAALKIDIGEIETIAHYKAANHFLPGVEFILDIGGQDMKCLRVKNGVIDDILLNEACSSGCGSFLETFSHSLNLPIQTFAAEALTSIAPVDLGSRCTVFMNSRVKQAQKEGAQVGDISAGLSYSVIKNALQKVIKLRDPESMGSKIIAQGGTFYNNAVLRAFEKIAEREVVRPDIAGIMGAYGAAIIALERWNEGLITTLPKAEELENFKFVMSMSRCELCSNKCLMTISTFSDGRKFVSGNRCEKGAGEPQSTKDTLPNLYDFKYKRLFAYKSLSKEMAIRGDIGVPRVLNMYENYPFWHTFLTQLGYRVVLSPKSTKLIYEEGIETIPSESACYPAKMVHGHIMHLINRGVSTIFYPSITHEEKEFEGVDNHYNCPIVTSYPETIKHNTDDIVKGNIRLIQPFMALDSIESAVKGLVDLFKVEGISKTEIIRAIHAAWDEKNRVKADIRSKGEEVVAWLKETKTRGIVLAGRPYHIDPEINHGLTKIITDLNMAVLTEDSIAHLGQMKRPIRVLDQWSYHSRLYQAAEVVGKSKELELVQLTSFGCGVDAVTSDQVHEILEKYGKLYTLIKIDEGNNLGAIRIRMRSLKAALDEKEKSGKQLEPKIRKYNYELFTKDNKVKHTIIAPQMAPMHFEFYMSGFHFLGYNVVLLPDVDRKGIDTGLKYVNNDACYPSILVTGQIIAALQSGDYDLENTSVFITQTGGGCRASNYIGFIRKALSDANIHTVRVLSINALGIEKHPGLELNLEFMRVAMMATVFGDLFMRMTQRVRPYELNEGETEEVFQYYKKKAIEVLKNGSLLQYRKLIKQSVKAFDAIPRVDKVIPRVGIVGEILIKYHPTGNNQLVKVLEKEGVEVCVPDLLDFFLYTAYNAKFKFTHLNGSRKQWIGNKIAIEIIEFFRRPMKKALKQSNFFKAPTRIEVKAKLAQRLISLGNQTGEGWFLTGEMVELVEHGIDNIVCVQPFACLPNHVVGKSMIKPIKAVYPYANIAAIDYDPGASEVNQLNRLKLMLSVAFSNLEKKLSDTQDEHYLKESHDSNPSTKSELNEDDNKKENLA
jgi:predicted CoA-substrate-specific enzyme activase